MPSFDIVSTVNMQEVDNAVNQARKEISTRYDFKDSKSRIDFDKENLTLLADDNMRLRSITEILNQKLAKRGIGLRSLDYQEPEKAGGDMLRQQVVIKQGISTEDARKIVKLIKDASLKKVQAQIQQDQVRVSGPKRDDLQQVIKLVKEKVDLELQFINYRD